MQSFALDVVNTFMTVVTSSLSAITEIYMNQGNDEYSKKDFRNAIDFYTEAIKVNCRDEELKAKLYSNRATAHFLRGEQFY